MTDNLSQEMTQNKILSVDMTGAAELEKLYICLSRMVGLHRQLYEVCKQEREAFVAADTKQILENTAAKELVIETVRHAEADRIRISNVIANLWHRPLSDLTLNFIIREIEPMDSKGAERFRSSLTALTVLIERTKKTNESNRVFVEQSLEHVREMKKNVLGEQVPQTDTYGNQGQKVGNVGGARLLSTEA